MSTTDTQQLDGEALLRIACAFERLDVSWRRGERILLEELLRGWSGEFRQALKRYRLRHWPRMAGLTVALVLAGLAWMVMGRHRRDMPSIAPAPAPVPLSGELTVRVWSRDDGPKRGLRVEDAGALPVMPGEWVHLEARLNPPVYAYLVWLDGQGQVVSLYPWGDRKFGNLPTTVSPQAVVQSPTALDEGWPMEGPAGLETVLLLVRHTPLPADADLPRLIGPLPPSRLRDAQEVAVLVLDAGRPEATVSRSLNRSPGAALERIDDPLLQLRERLRPYFEVTRAVRFAYRGE
jgi:hypothetical protein